MTPRSARSAKNERAYAGCPSSQGKHFSTIGVMGKNGMTFDHTFQGYLNKSYFIEILEAFIIPVFSNTSKYLIMDNCSSHNNKDVIKLLEENNVNYLFLSPYSPEYNPIELAWSKLKHYVRKAEARCEIFLILAIKKAIDSISSDDARGYFKHVSEFYINLS